MFSIFPVGSRVRLRPLRSPRPLTFIAVRPQSVSERKKPSAPRFTRKILSGADPGELEKLKPDYTHNAGADTEEDIAEVQ